MSLLVCVCLLTLCIRSPCPVIRFAIKWSLDKPEPGYPDPRVVRAILGQLQPSISNWNYYYYYYYYYCSTISIFVLFCVLLCVFLLYLCLCLCISFIIHAWLIWRSDDRASWYILIKNQLDALISQICFWNKTLHVSDSSSVHHQQFFTVHTATVYVIQVTVTACEQDQDGTSSVLILLASCQQICMTYTVVVYNEKLLMMNRGTVRNM